MKRILSLMLVCVTLLSLCSMALATEITNNTSNSANITVQYGVDSSYSVTIPESATINAAGMGTLTVSVSNAILEANNELFVSVTGDSYADSYWNLTDSRNNTNKLKYTIVANNAVIAPNDCILRIKPAEAYNRTVSTVMDLMLANTTDYAGRYVDTLTFIVDLHSHVNNDNDALCDECGDVVSTGSIPLDNGATGSLGQADAPVMAPPPMFFAPSPQKEVFDLTLGDFKAVTEVTPGEYETIEKVTITSEFVRRPFVFNQYAYSAWIETKDANGEVTKVVPTDVPNIESMPYIGEYIVYEPGIYTNATHEVFTDVENNKAWLIFAHKYSTLANTLSSLAYYKCFGTGTIPAEGITFENLVICHWNGSNYEVVDYSAEIDALAKPETWYDFTKHVSYETVQTREPSANTDLVYTPTTTVKAESGMTWEDWLASPYNTTGLSNPTIKTSDYEDVALTDVIDPNKEYALIGLTNAVSGVWEISNLVDFVFEVEPNDILEEYVAITINGTQYDAFMFECRSQYRPTGMRYVYYIHAMHPGNTGCTTLWQGVSITNLSTEHNQTIVVDFGSTPQTVSPEFYEWLHTYGTPIS